MSSYSAYNFGSAAPEQLQFDRYGIEVIPGGRSRAHSEQSAIPAVVGLCAKILLAFVMVFAVVGVVRVTLSSATIAFAMEANEIDSQIDDAREAGNLLEVEQSTLSNPKRIKGEAANLGLVSPPETTYINLMKDVVVKDESGALSLSGSIAAATEL